MQKRITSLVLMFVLMFSLFATAHAADSTTSDTATTSEAVLTGATVSAISADESDLSYNGVPVKAEIAYYNDVMYCSLRSAMESIRSDTVYSCSNSQLTITVPGLTISARPGSYYMVANGRYLYAAGKIVDDGGITMVPARLLAKALGGTLAWNSVTGKANIISTAGAITDGNSYYDSDDLYWLSRIINAESGNQPMVGKIAVANVILNRVASASFPNTVAGVISERNQFSTYTSGAIYRTPNAESVIAAKLALDGAVTVERATYFNTNGINCWAARNKTVVAVIGGHTFYR